MAGSREAWERVLNAIEADARRAEALLDGSSAPHPTPPADAAADGPTEPGHGPVGMPAEWLVPLSAELPAFDEMPPVPEELSDRILGLRAEIMRLQGELAAALRDMPRPSARQVVAVAAAEVPSYIDRRL